MSAPFQDDPAAVRAVLQSLGAGMYATDADGRVSWVNREAELLLGRLGVDLVGQSAHEVLHARRRDGSPFPRAECPLLAVLTTGTKAEDEDDVFLRADGTALPVTWVSAPVLQDGEVTGAVVVFRSNEARHRLQEQREQALAAERAEQVRVRAALDRLELLRDVSALLAGAVDLRGALGRLARVLVPRLADGVVLELLGEDGGLARAAVASRAPAGEVSEPERDLPEPAGSRAPLARVLAGAGTTRLREEDLAALAVTVDPLAQAQARALADLRATEALVVPLVARRQVLGALTLSRSARSFGAEERELAEDLAGRVALALQNDRLVRGQRAVSETLQRSLLTMLPHVDHIRIAARYEPAGRHSQVGGDWYDSFLLPDGCTALVIGDIAGHDVDSAARMGQVRNILRGIAVDRVATPAEVVSRLDAAVDRLGAAGLATLVYARVELQPDGSRRLRWSNAGHPPPLLVHADGRTQLLDSPPDLPLGVLPGEPREEAELVLPPGCTVLLYTDGLVETRADSVDVGLVRLRQAAGKHAQADVETFCDRVLADLENVHDNPDDIAVLALRVPRSEDDGPPPDTDEEKERAAEDAGQPELTAGPPARGA